MYKEIKALLMQKFNGDEAKVNIWLYTPHYLFGKFTPISMILSNEAEPILKWLKQ